MTLLNETAVLTEENVFVDDLLTLLHNYNLIVWNDNKNTFEWVIETLVEICGHTFEQAEQCAFIIHFNGKYAVKQGDFETLSSMHSAITDRGINATIEETVES